MDEDLKEAIMNLTMEFHRERFGRPGIIIFKGINMSNKSEIKVLYKVEDQLFMIEMKIGLPGQSTK